MKKLYIFGIGGTGSRVLRALSMLLAAGVKIQAESIVPIIIDPDDAAGDMTRTVELMRAYEEIHKKLDHNNSVSNEFFSVKIERLVNNYRLILANTQKSKFKNYMDFSSLDDANKALANMLFSEENLNSDMNVGFKGNPNIGSVVLNQFIQSPEFIKFTSTFQQGDGIFIISSIFGGTGASGFPVLLKNLRTLKQKVTPEGKPIGNAALIQKAPIGAITVLPYFGIEPNPESKIDESTFISKTKAALSYYEANMNVLNALYYIADDIKKHYPNVEGGKGQVNKAHFIELASALAVIDFTMLDPEQLENNEFGVALNPIYKEFGIEKDSDEIQFKDLGPKTYEQLKYPLTQFTLFCKYMDEQLKDSIKSQPWANGKMKFDSSFTTTEFYNSSLAKIKRAYLEWLEDMAQNERSFCPFELSEKKHSVFSLVKGIEAKRIMSLKSNYPLFDDRLNAIEPRIANDCKIEQRFIELFYQATKKLISEKIKF